MTNRNPLKVPLITLAVIYTALIVLWLLIKNKDISDYLINVSVEVLGAIITIAFIDIYLNKHEKRIADKREKIVWTILKPLMRSHFSLLFNLYKASTTKRGVNVNTSDLSNFFSEDYIETISNLNVSSKAPVFPDQTWTNYLRTEFDQFNRKYDAILDKYSTHIEPELVKVLENIKNSVFHHHMVTGLSMIEGLNKRNGFAIPKDIFRQLFTREHAVSPYLHNLKELLILALKVDIMQDFFQIDDGHWRNDISPSIGSSRI